MPESFARPQGTGPGVADLSAPKLAGRYVRLAEHPGVFTTRSELNALAKQINVPGSYSAKRFHQLAAQVKRDVSGRNEWGAAYSGCNLDIYLMHFPTSHRQPITLTTPRRFPQPWGLTQTLRLLLAQQLLLHDWPCMQRC